MLISTSKALNLKLTNPLLFAKSRREGQSKSHPKGRVLMSTSCRVKQQLGFLASSQTAEQAAKWTGKLGHRADRKNCKTDAMFFFLLKLGRILVAKTKKRIASFSIEKISI